MDDFENVLAQANFLSNRDGGYFVCKMVEEQAIEPFVFVLVCLQGFFDFAAKVVYFVLGLNDVLIERRKHLENDVVALNNSFAVVRILLVLFSGNELDALQVLDLPHAQVHNDAEGVHFAQDRYHLL